MDASSQQIGAGSLATAIGDAENFNAGRLPEGFAQDVRHGGKTEAKRQLAGVGLGIGHKFRDILGRD